MKAIVTVCNANYSLLLSYWSVAIRKVTNLPIFVLCLNGHVPMEQSNLKLIKTDSAGNPFPENLPDHACAEKVRVFEHLPQAVEQILFLDLDLLVMYPFWEKGDLFEESRTKLVMCPDLFVGYKEKMEVEFQPYDSLFRMKFNPDGSYFYFNTGVFFASRSAHQQLFRIFLETWQGYVDKLSMYPSIFDQNIFNYCLIKYGVDVLQMPLLNNCLRQYEKQAIVGGKITLNGQVVNAYHFNGGDSVKKLERWREMVQKLENPYVDS